VIKRCDVGVYVGQQAGPVLKENTFEASFFTGIFAEMESRPNLVSNHFNGGSKIGDLTGSQGLDVVLFRKFLKRLRDFFGK
jgi:hypothetical protein